jgi:regulator of sigma E protease
MEFLSSLSHWAFVLVVFLVMMSLLVAAHELGHYLFAGYFGMGVEEFAIGFGKKRLVTYARKQYQLPIGPGEDPTIEVVSEGYGLEGGTQTVQRTQVDTPNGPVIQETTDFTFRPFPLGGFVRIKGMLPQEDGSETRIPGGFYSKPPWQRLVVLFAGPLFSVIFGVLLLVPVYTISGIDQPLNEPVLGGLAKGEPADRAGLKPNDRIVSIDGKRIETFYGLTQTIHASAGKSLTLQVDRNGQPLTLTVTPVSGQVSVSDPDLQPTGERKQAGKIGVIPKSIKKPMAVGPAFREALTMPVKAVQSVARLFLKPQTFEDNVGGPATIVATTSAMSTRGVEYVIFLSAMLSISLGIFNLVPVPPLDGGQMVIAFAEMLRRGKRLSMRVQSAVAGVGFALVVGLMIAVIVVDIRRFSPLGDSSRGKEVEIIRDQP